MISECCGAEDRLAQANGMDWSDIGKCPLCRESCKFISEKEFGERYALEQIENALGEDDENSSQ